MFLPHAIPLLCLLFNLCLLKFGAGSPADNPFRMQGQGVWYWGYEGERDLDMKAVGDDASGLIELACSRGVRALFDRPS